MERVYVFVIAGAVVLGAAGGFYYWRTTSRPALSQFAACMQSHGFAFGGFGGRHRFGSGGPSASGTAPSGSGTTSSGGGTTPSGGT